jgi:hypothetical protein
VSGAATEAGSGVQTWLSWVARMHDGAIGTVSDGRDIAVTQAYDTMADRNGRGKADVLEKLNAQVHPS